MISKNELLNELERRAKIFLKHLDVEGVILPFEDAAIDALAYWWLVMRARSLEEVTQVLVLPDWGLKHPKWCTLEENKDFVEKCWNGKAYNQTYKHLFQNGSRNSLGNGSTFLLNAVCGQRSPEHFTSSLGDLGPEIHVAAIDFWMWPLTQLNLDRVYLAGPWAHSLIDCKAGEHLPAAEYLLAQWPRCEIVEMTKDALGDTPIYFLHHPYSAQFSKKNQFEG